MNNIELKFYQNGKVIKTLIDPDYIPRVGEFVQLDLVGKDKAYVSEITTTPANKNALSSLLKKEVTTINCIVI